MTFLIRCTLVVWLSVASLAGYAGLLDSQPEWSIEFSAVDPALDKDQVTQLQERLEAALKAHRGAHQPYGFYDSPRKFAMADQSFVQVWLEAQSYYDNNVTYTVNDEGGDAPIALVIDTGKRYLLAAVDVEVPDTITAPALDELPIAIGNPLDAEHVLAAKKHLQTEVLENNCLFKVAVDYSARIAIESKKAALRFDVKPSPQVTFGEVTWDGLQTIKDKIIKNTLTLKQGACFQRSELDKQRLAFLSNGLLSAADQKITLNEATQAVDVHYTFTEAKHRTIKSGVAMITDEGFALSGGWEHRNFFGGGERLTLDASISKKKQFLKSELELPYFYSPKNNLIINGSIKNEELDAYDVRAIDLGTNLKHIINQRSFWQAGVRFKHSKIMRPNSDEIFNLISFPLKYTLDTSKNPLDPRSGAKSDWLVEPFYVFGDGSVFTKVRGSLTGYKTAENLKWQPTLAVRLAAGSIWGAENLTTVPDDERFYVGGGGSVRGFPYQKIGPLNADNKPLGGLSFVETSIETRIHITDQLGVAVFVEGGSAYLSQTPKFDDDWLWAAGLGLRVYSGFAPIRVDFGFPIDRREGVDDAFQLYISIGEAF